MNHGAPFDAALDYSAWDALKVDVVQLLHDPALQQRIAYHFSRIQTLVGLIDKHYDFTFGLQSETNAAASTRESLREYLIPTLTSLVEESAALIARIEEEKLKRS